MEYTYWNDYRLSRLMLGTVQFGLPYGVANRVGQPSSREVLSIIEVAVDGGVNCFDTASMYGTSELVLGQALEQLRIAESVVVVTKIRQLTPTESGNAVLAATAIERSVAESRRRLKLECIPMVMFHRESDAVYLEVLEKLKRRGWLKHYGVSCANMPGPALEFAANGGVTVLQIPANVLDPRHRHSGILQQPRARELAVFSRSVYLQGLLLMSDHDTPHYLRDVIPVRTKLAEIASDSGISLAELALRYMISLTGITSVLVGVETVSQIQNNIEMVDRGTLSTHLMTEIDHAVPALAEKLITPSSWPST